MDSSTVWVAATKALETRRDEAVHSPANILTRLSSGLFPICMNRRRKFKGKSVLQPPPDEVRLLNKASLRQGTAESSNQYAKSSLRTCHDHASIFFLFASCIKRTPPLRKQPGRNRRLGEARAGGIFSAVGHLQRSAIFCEGPDHQRFGCAARAA